MGEQKAGGCAILLVNSIHVISSFYIQTRNSTGLITALRSWNARTWMEVIEK